MADLSLNVMINKQKSKVLFAEANNDFIDVILSFLTLPLGKLVTILNDHYGNESPVVIGSLNTLYTGLVNLDSTLFTVRGAKQMLLNPANSSGEECCNLKVNISLQPNKYFICQNAHCLKYGFVNITLYTDVAVCECGKPLNREVRVEGDISSDDDGGVFAVNSMFFVITDDLRVAPIATGILQTLNILGVTDTQGAELTSVSFGRNEIMELLKLSLTSASPLTDLIIKKNEKSSTSTTAMPELGILLHHNSMKNDANARKMVLKVCLQKSTNKFLFAEAADEFLHFLLSLLTIPLGAVEFLLGGNTCLKNVDNLYKSVKDFFDEKYFTTPEAKNRLINPKLAHGYVKPNQFLPLEEDSPPKLYYSARWTGKRYNTSFYEKESETDEKESETDDDEPTVSDFKLSKENFVKNQTICFVTDDLTVTPSLTKSISILNDLGIPLSDVKEMELQVGLEEALRILNASLTSKTPLTDALIKPMLNKLPKLEHQLKQER